MNNIQAASEKQNLSFVRIGGFAILLGFTIHIVANIFLKTFPPENPSLEILVSYLDTERPTWAIVHGLRYLAFTCISIFGAALFVYTSCRNNDNTIGWGVIGLIGVGFQVISGCITNGIEMLVFMNFELLSKSQDLFWFGFNLTRILFTAEMAAWGILIGGFSFAGFFNRTLPRWIVFYGLLCALACLGVGVFIVPIMNGAPISIIADIASILSMVWYLVIGLIMIRAIN